MVEQSILSVFLLCLSSLYRYFKPDVSHVIWLITKWCSLWTGSAAGKNERKLGEKSGRVGAGKGKDGVFPSPYSAASLAATSFFSFFQAAEPVHRLQEMFKLFKTYHIETVLNPRLFLQEHLHVNMEDQ